MNVFEGVKSLSRASGNTAGVNSTNHGDASRSRTPAKSGTRVGNTTVTGEGSARIDLRKSAKLVKARKTAGKFVGRETVVFKLKPYQWREVHYRETTPPNDFFWGQKRSG